MNVRPLMIGFLVVAIVTLLTLAILRGRRAAPPPDQQQQVQTFPIPVAKVDLPQGQQITEDSIEMKDMTQEEVDALPPDALHAKEAILGGTTAVAIPAGSPFTPSMFVPLPTGVSDKVEAGYVAVTIPAPETPSLYDLKFLKPDDRVDVFGVQNDDQKTRVTSVRLATNVRVLAVDTVYDTFVEERRRAEIQAKIDQLKAERDAALKATPPPQQEQIDTQYNKPIEQLEAELDPKIENPSVTLELTHDQAQKIALWRQTSPIQLALHRREDAETAIFDPGMMALPTPGTVGSGVITAPQAVLTLDDVVSLKERDPQKYADRLRAEDDLRRMKERQALDRLEDQVHAAELQVELRNLKRYGSRNAPTVNVPSVPPVMAPSGGGGGAGGAEIARLGQRVDQLTQAVRELRDRAPSRAVPPRQTIEIIRGSERTSVEY